MAAPHEVVAEQFSIANAYAASASAKADIWLERLANSLYAPPSLSVTWHPVEAAPTFADPVKPPGLSDVSGIEFDEDILNDKPAPFTALPPNVNISGTFEDAPTLTPAPTLAFGTVPAIPAVSDITVPDAPTVALPTIPAMLSLSTPVFGGVDLHPEFLSKFNDVPDLVLAAPTPFSHAPSAKYTSALLEALQTSLRARLNGGTGLKPEVEQQIWDRARDREVNLTQGAIRDVLRQSEALGFSLPAGATQAALRQAMRDRDDKLSSLSRDVAIKQAELEQDNLKDTVAQAIQLEGLLIDQALRMETLAFEISKAYADNAIQAHNAQVEQFKSLMARAQTLATVYRSIIDAELAKVEVFKGLLQAEQTKAEINKSLVEQYKAEIEGRMAVVRLYEAQLGGINSKVQIERTRIEAASESIKGYVASMNAETAKLEAWKAGEGAKVDIYRAKAQAFGSVTQAQAQAATANIAAYTGRIQAKTEEWRGWGIQVDAERARIDAVLKTKGILLEGFKADMALYEAKTTVAVKRWETQIKEYEAKQNYTITAWKINADHVNTMNAARLDAAKTGAQIYSQQFASSLSRISTGATVSASGGTSVSYSYSNKTANEPPALTTA